MSFNDIFKKTDVAACLEPGLQALGKYSRWIEGDELGYIEGSVDIDTCLTKKYPQDNRWDYAFGLKNRLYYVEFHHLTDSEVSVVIAKYSWLKDWQNRQPNPHELKANSSYYWIVTKGSLAKGSRYRRMLTSAGLDYPKKTLNLVTM